MTFVEGSFMPSWRVRQVAGSEPNHRNLRSIAEGEAAQDAQDLEKEMVRTKNNRDLNRQESGVLQTLSRHSQQPLWTGN